MIATLGVFFHVQADGAVGEEAEGGIGGVVGHDYTPDGPAFALVIAEHHRQYCRVTAH